MLNRKSVRINRSFDRFTIGGPFVDETARLTNQTVLQDAISKPIPDVARSKVPWQSNHSRVNGAVTGQIDGPVPGIPMQSMKTSSPKNKIRSRTGPISSRDIVAAVLEKRRGNGTNSAGQRGQT